MKKNIAIFASGSGSNAENIIRYFQKNDSALVSLVLSNKSDAYVLERAHRLGVPCNVFTKEDWIAGDEILAVLQEYRIDFICWQDSLSACRIYFCMLILIKS